MLLLPYVYHALESFRHVFSRRSTYLSFCLVVLSLLGVSSMEGVSSLARFWGMEEAGYHSLLHLFRSTAWSVQGLAVHWDSFVVQQAVVLQVDGRAVLLGDHTYAPKDATRMPGVVTLHQNSETQSKPSYFRGHHWGLVGALCGTLGEALCIPLRVGIHQGFAHLLQKHSSEEGHETLGVRIVQMALDFAVRHHMPSTLVLDAFFSSGPVFALAASVYSVALKQPLVQIITRAKKSYVAYFPASTSPKAARGRPRKYGKKIKLVEVFTKYKSEFLRAECRIYGKQEVVLYKALNLLWKPLGAPLRFIFATTSRGQIVLMCSDLQINSLKALTLYCSRTRIETLFWVLKGLLGALEYRFWSKRLPRHSRKPTKNSTLKGPEPQHLPIVSRTWEACERFVSLGCVALGLLQLLSLKFGAGIWDRFEGFLRTRSRSLPSERTVREVLRRELLEDFHKAAPSATMQEFRARVRATPKSAQNSQDIPPPELLQA